MRLFRPCFLAGLIFNKAQFRLRTSEKILCLTFDDGPDPHSTNGLLDTLDALNVKALFFCSGSAAEKYPDLISEIKRRGHLIGNHGYSHLNGWETKTHRYIEDVKNASDLTSGKLFRPPYGKLRFSQYRKLKKSYNIVFWDLMAYDFDKSFGAGRSLDILNQRVRPGSIIVLHDTPASACNSIVGDFINHSMNNGYRFGLYPFL